MSCDKSALRQILLLKRRALSTQERRAKSARIAKLFASIGEFKAGARIAVYLPMSSEVDTSSIIRAARARGVSLYAPRIVDLARRRMQFVPLHRAHAGLALDRKSTVAVPRIDPRWLNVIALPLVGFDCSGMRVGMGAGFYDRALNFRRARMAWRGPRLIGLGFDCQRASRIDGHPWDVRLDCVISESGLEKFPRGCT